MSVGLLTLGVPDAIFAVLMCDVVLIRDERETRRKMEKEAAKVECGWLCVCCCFGYHREGRGKLGYNVWVVMVHENSEMIMRRVREVKSELGEHLGGMWFIGRSEMRWTRFTVRGREQVET